MFGVRGEMDWAQVQMEAVGVGWSRAAKAMVSLESMYHVSPAARQGNGLDRIESFSVQRSADIVPRKSFSLPPSPNVVDGARTPEINRYYTSPRRREFRGLVGVPSARATPGRRSKVRPAGNVRWWQNK